MKWYMVMNAMSADVAQGAFRKGCFRDENEVTRCILPGLPQHIIIVSPHIVKFMKFR